MQQGAEQDRSLRDPTPIPHRMSLRRYMRDRSSANSSRYVERGQCYEGAFVRRAEPPFGAVRLDQLAELVATHG